MKILFIDNTNIKAALGWLKLYANGLGMRPCFRIRRKSKESKEIHPFREGVIRRKSSDYRDAQIHKMSPQEPHDYNSLH